MRRRKGWKRAAMARVEATMMTGDCETYPVARHPSHDEGTDHDHAGACKQFEISVNNESSANVWRQWMEHQVKHQQSIIDQAQHKQCAQKIPADGRANGT
jgi:hypothetical protein